MTGVFLLPKRNEPRVEIWGRSESAPSGAGGWGDRAALFKATVAAPKRDRKRSHKEKVAADPDLLSLSRGFIEWA